VLVRFFDETRRQLQTLRPVRWCVLIRFFDETPVEAAQFVMALEL